MLSRGSAGYKTNHAFQILSAGSEIPDMALRAVDNALRPIGKLMIIHSRVIRGDEPSFKSFHKCADSKQRTFFPGKLRMFAGRFDHWNIRGRGILSARAPQ